MRRSKIFAMALVLVCFGCNKQPTTVVLHPTAHSDQRTVQDFVADFSVALQEMPVCSRVKLITDDSLKDSAALTNEIRSSQWRLIVPVIPEADTDHGKQFWVLEHKGQTVADTWSSPKSMAASVCSIVKGKGGTVQGDE